MLNSSFKEKDMSLKRKDENFITLKEASDMSGYSSDYLGQLIRSGKLEGEQVFMNVAWMTTREAVEEYMRKSKGKKAPNEDVPENRGMKEKVLVVLVEHWEIISRTFLYAVIVITVLFIALLVHLVSFSIEKHLEMKDILREPAARAIDHA